MFLRKLQANVSNHAVTLLLPIPSPSTFRLSQIGRAEPHAQRFAITVSFRRNLLTLRQLYSRAPSRPSVSPCRMGGASTSTSLKNQLVQAMKLPQHDASAGLKRFSEPFED